MLRGRDPSPGIAAFGLCNLVPKLVSDSTEFSRSSIAILDFDFASPGRRVWDLAMAARMWVPLRPHADDDPRDATTCARRLGHLVAGHGLARTDHEEFDVAGARRGRVV
jgi:hypothetical protein